MCSVNLINALVNLQDLFPTQTNPTPPSSSSDSAVIDSGASNHYLTKNAPCSKAKPIFFGPIVTLPGGDTMQANKQTSLEHPQLSPSANKAYIFPALKSANLLSVGQLCDDDCYVIFDKQQVLVFKHNQIILQGHRNHHNGMWQVPLPLTQQQHFAHGIIKKETSVNDLINFLHAAAFSPSKSTWIEAVRRNYFVTWPGVTVKAIQKYLSPSRAPAKGHLDQTQKNQQSTKNDAFYLPPEMLDTKKHHVVMAALIPIETGKIFTDQTGRFLVV